MKEFVEKLIGRLEEEVKSTREMQTIQCKGNDGYGTPIQAKLSGEICALLKAKNIVNQLAEEYNNDVCEWEKGSSGYVGYPAYYSRCCTTNSKGLEMQTHIISDWKFCPYCGKKIKVSPYQPKGE